MKISDIIINQISEATSRKDAERAWGSMIEPPKAPVKTTQDTITGKTIQKPKSKQAEPKTADILKVLAAKRRIIQKYQNQIIPNLIQKVKLVAKRDNRYLNSDLIKLINPEDYYFPRTLEGELTHIIPMDVRLQNLITAYEQQANKLKHWIKYPAAY